MARVKKIFCNVCKVETNHEIDSVHYRYCKNDADLKLLLFQETTAYDESLDFGDNLGVLKYETWICRGCDTVILQESCAIKYMALQKHDKIIWFYDFYPFRENDNVITKDLGFTPAKLFSLYHEIAESFNMELPVLCSMGLRAMIEGVCKDKGITDKDAYTLAEKIDELAKRQQLPSAIAENLKSYKFIGDSAAHYLETPDRESLKLGIDVIGDLLSYLYALEYKSEYLNRRISENLNIKKKRE
jgi:hypothetical protein